MRSLVAAVLTAAVVGAASAAPFTNGSFENGIGAPGGGFTTLGTGSTAITGWTVGGNSVDWIGGYWTASHGSRSVDLSGNNAGSLSQTFDTVAGQAYQVTFDLAGNPDGSPVVKNLLVDVGGATTSYTFDTTGKSAGSMGWTSFSYFFTAAGGSTTLRFASNDNTAYGPALDNVRVTAVPEPVSLVAFGGLVVGGIVAVRRRVSAKG